MKRLRRALGSLLVCVLILQTLFITNETAKQVVQAEKIQENVLGKIVDEWTRKIAPGVEETTLTMDGKIGRQSAFIMDVAAENSDVVLKAGLPNGNEFGLQTVREQASHLSKQGHIVVGGVNADFFDMSNGIPEGTVIQDRKVLKAGKRESLGIKENGEAIIGYPNPSFSIITNGNEKKLDSINFPRGENQLVAYTPEVKTTGTSPLGTEVILSGIDEDIRMVGTVSGKVEKVLNNEGSTPVQEGQVVLSGHGNAALFLQSLTVGQKVQLSTRVEEGWQDVKQALSGRIILIKNGEKVDFQEDSFTTAKAPRTAVGIREDGSMFFVVIDGRQPGYAEGITVFELRDFMYELGAKEALNLDGGGSSTFVTRELGEHDLTVVNSPSDGKERPVANSFFIVSTTEQTELSQLAVKPDHLLMLSGSQTTFTAQGMDKSYNPVEISGKPSWSASDERLGKVNQNGHFTAGETAMTGEVKADFNGVKGSAEITVTNELTTLRFPQKEMTVKRGEEVELKVEALLQGKAVYANPENFEWIVEGDIGTVDKQGIFKAADKTGNGTITVKHGEVTDTINIQVGKMPIILEDFENGIDHWTTSGARYNSVSIRQTTYPEPVRFDNHALQLDYDFIGTIGTSGAYAYPKENITIDGYPDTIGMWVYGDRSGHWLRAQLRDGKNNAFPIDFTHQIDWEGWKYVEAPVPKGKETPLQLDLPIRLMETDNDNKNAGTIYVDQIRAVYGETDDDLINPEITQEIPADNEVVGTNKVKISAIAKDNEGGSGIHPERILMYVDGKEVQATFNEKTGEISYIAEEALLDGYHRVKVIVQDRFGNQTEKTWQFEVNSGNVGIKPVYSESAYVGNNYSVKLAGKTLEKVQSLKLHFKYDPKKLTKNQNSVQLHEAITDHHIVKNEMDDSGNIYLELKDLQTIKDIEKINEMGRIPFSVPLSAKNDFSIEFISGELTLIEKENPINLYMPTIHAQVNAHLSLEINRASVGFPAKLRLRDEKGKAVKDAEVKVNSPENELAIVRTKTAKVFEQPDASGEVIAKLTKHDHAVIIAKKQDWLHIQWGDLEGWLKTKEVDQQPWVLGKTDAQGELKTNKLSLIPGEINIQANKKEKYSYELKINVLHHLGTNKPKHNNITFNKNDKALNITWTTSPKITESIVEVVPTADFKKEGFRGKTVRRMKGKSEPHPFDEGELQMHYATIDNLTENKMYTYRVGDGNSDSWSKPATFKAKTGKNEPFNFILMGDTQAPPNQSENGFGIFTELFKKAKKQYPDAAFMIHVGDMVDDGNMYSHWNAFLQSMKDQELAPSTPIVPTVGNHENIGNGLETFKQIFRIPLNGPKDFRGTVYSFDYGNAHFAILNTETSKEGLIEQGKWLKQDMAKSKKKWKIAVFHRPPYYSNPPGGSDTVLEVFPKFFDDANIDLAISGHDHAYVRTFPLKSEEKAVQGTTYLIAGSTGPKFYPATPQPYMDIYFDEKVQVYTNIEVNDKQINIITQTRDGRVIDEHTIE